VQDFAWTRSAIPGDPCVVDVELGFAVAPVTVVLQQGWGELRGNDFRGEKERAAKIQNGFHDNSIHQAISTKEIFEHRPLTPSHPCHFERSRGI
jgi:hypothetical protein